MSKSNVLGKNQGIIPIACNFEWKLLHGDNSYKEMMIETEIDLNEIYLMVPTLIISCVLVVEKMRIKCQKRKNKLKST